MARKMRPGKRQRLQERLEKAYIASAKARACLQPSPLGNVRSAWTTYFNHEPMRTLGWNKTKPSKRALAWEWDGVLNRSLRNSERAAIYRQIRRKAGLTA